MMYLIIGCMLECDLYWSGEVGCGTSITLETCRDDWRGQTKHKVIRVTERNVPCNMSIDIKSIIIMVTVAVFFHKFG